MGSKDELYTRIENLETDMVFLINEMKAVKQELQKEYNNGPIPKGNFNSLEEFIKEFEHLNEVSNGS